MIINWFGRSTVDRAKAFTLIELLVVIAIFAGMIVLLTPFVKMVKNRSDEINCANNLRRISLALHMYARNNNDAFPPTVGALYPEYLKDEKTFDCPATKSIGIPDKPDYEYAAGLAETSVPDEVIVYDLSGNHKTSGRNILRINGSVEHVRTSEEKPR